MARKRSWQELKSLERAINMRAIRQGSSDLSEKASYLASKYASNIAQSKSGRNNADAYKKAFGNDKKRSAIADRALNRKYSSNTYKGVANG